MGETYEQVMTKGVVSEKGQGVKNGKPWFRVTVKFFGGSRDFFIGDEATYHRFGEKGTVVQCRSELTTGFDGSARVELIDVKPAADASDSSASSRTRAAA